MYLKQLGIHGFKSFAEKIELNFVNGINAVVGPNGSGKSNISDAIRWVLGEQSAKNLRGSKMEDIIFAGSDKKKALGFAEVSLVIDNSDKKINVDYTEINITRRVYRSGESEYYLNKTPCRLKDIYEIFMDTGIGKDGYSIIGQGRIDEILSNKSEDRRLIFEEAAGIVKYKTRKQEAERKLEHTKQNIVRIQDIIQEIEGQLEPLSQQAEVAKRYRSIIEELKVLEINLLLNSIDKLKNRLETLKGDSKAIEELMGDKINHSTKLESRYSRFKIELTQIENSIVQQNNLIYNSMNYLERNEGECNLIKEKIQNFEDNIGRLQKEKSELIEDLERTLYRIKNSDNQVKQLENDYIELNKKIDLLTAEYKSHFEAMSLIEQELEGKQQKIIELINKSSDIKSKINSSQAFIDNIKKRVKQINYDISAFENQKAEKLSLQIENENSLNNCKCKLEDCKKALESLKIQKIEYEKQIAVSEKNIISLRSEKEAIASRLKVLEEMEKDFGGYSKSVRTLLSEIQNTKKIAKGFRGVIGELINVPPQYATAIEIALGSSVQSIVTEDEDDAKQLIAHLKAHKLGRATFLPISAVRWRGLNEREIKLLSTDGVIGIASELIGYDKSIKGVINNLLGRVVVTDNMETAVKLAKLSGYEFRIVTLEGEIINPGGSITGGSITATPSSVITRKSEIQKLNEAYRSKKIQFDKALEKLADLKQCYSNCDLELSCKTDIYHSLQIEYNNIQNKCSNIKNEILIIEDRLAIFLKELEELLAEEIQTNNSLKQYFEKFEAINLEKSKLEQEVSDIQLQMREFKEAKDKYNSNITSLKVKKASIEENRKSLRQEKSELEEKVVKLRNRIAFIDDETQNAKKGIDDNKAKLQEKLLESETIKHSLEKAKADITVKEESKLELQKTMVQIEEEIKEYNKDVSMLQGELHKAEIQQAKIEIELENVELKLLESYDMNYNKANNFRDEKLNLSWASKKCEELKAEIREMGTINVNAVEEYAKTKDRYDFLKKQVEDLINAKESLIKVIEEITENMKRQFINEFEKINKNFNEVFIQLFGGGYAQLILSDEDNVLESGIDIIAKPPGKKLQNLTLLSGGERALTAIALLFGILKMKPSPFCVLDEIDAALDDANVGRYASFLKDFSVDTQFIIITHRKGSMEAADCLYGVSMEESGISKLLSVKLEDKVS